MDSKNELLIHPGEHLVEFLEEYSLSGYALAKSLNVPPTRISEIVHCNRSITTDTALRLGRYFGTSAMFWLNLQLNYDLAIAKSVSEKNIIEEVVPRVA